MATEVLPDFGGLFDSAGRGEVLIPRIKAALQNKEFGGFTVDMPDFGEREPDGWFHPSTHPTWDERQLFHYLANPSYIIPEEKGPHNVMAIMQGHFWHTFMEVVGLREGWLVDPGICICGCGKREHYWEHAGTKTRGHGDGVVNAAVLPIEHDEVWEFKTMERRRAERIPCGAPDDPAVLEAFRALVPEYHAQGQEYMRISGYRSWRAIIFSLSYPYPMREIMMQFDHAFAYETSSKYERVIAAIEHQVEPLPCCKPRSATARGCPARGICEVGRG